MHTSVIGYPRVGSLRELKFATEKYFRKEISDKQLQNVAIEIRKEAWITQELILFLQMIFLSMIICWIQPHCLTLFQNATVL